MQYTGPITSDPDRDPIMIAVVVLYTTPERVSYQVQCMHGEDSHGLYIEPRANPDPF